MANTKTTTKAKAEPEKTATTTAITPAKAKAAKPARIDLSDSTLVRVRSNQYGRMGFRNSRTGDFTFWNDINDVQDMTVGDIRVMRGSSSVFFRDTWVVIEAIEDERCDDMTQEQLYDVLGLTRYFNTARPKYLRDVLSWDQIEINERVPKMSRTTRDNVAVALNTEIAAGNLNDIRVIRAWEQALGIELDLGDTAAI